MYNSRNGKKWFQAIILSYRTIYDVCVSYTQTSGYLHIFGVLNHIRKPNRILEFASLWFSLRDLCLIYSETLQPLLDKNVQSKEMKT